MPQWIQDYGVSVIDFLLSVIKNNAASRPHTRYRAKTLYPFAKIRMKGGR